MGPGGELRERIGVGGGGAGGELRERCGDGPRLEIYDFQIQWISIISMA